MKGISLPVWCASSCHVCPPEDPACWQAGHQVSVCCYLPVCGGGVPERQMVRDHWGCSQIQHNLPLGGTGPIFQMYSSVCLPSQLYFSMCSYFGWKVYGVWASGDPTCRSIESHKLNALVYKPRDNHPPCVLRCLCALAITCCWNHLTSMLWVSWKLLWIRPSSPYVLRKGLTQVVW